MGPYKATCMEVVQQYYPDFDSTSFLLCIGGAASVSSVVCASLLVQDFDGWSRSALFKYDFSHGCVDLLYLSVFQVVSISLATVLARKAQHRPQKSTNHNDNNSKEKRNGFFRFLFRKGFRYMHLTSSGDTKEPLLDQGVEKEDTGKLEETKQMAISGKGGQEGYEDEDKRINDQFHRKIDASDIAHKKSAEIVKSYSIALVFMISTGVQVYTGLKCISFEYDDETSQGAMMGLNVLWINLIVWVSRELIKKGPDETGIMIPELHKHKLHLDLNAHMHWCDLCLQKNRDGMSLRCRVCDFDVCMRCYNKKDKGSLEGQLRGDKGIRRGEETEMATKGFFWRALRLIQDEWKIFGCAMLALLIATCASLVVPNLQGSILNAVVDDDHGQFYYFVKAYVLISCVKGFVAGVQQLCLAIAGRRLTFKIRTSLFRNIINQDVAFFDGNTSGHLTSRIQSDVFYMVQPIQSMLGTIISNSLLLVGGLVLCFYTSWRLSMLAFTTIAPIVHISKWYAQFSQSLNRKIHSAIGAANSLAVEALANIRTVKSFATEEYEYDRYNEVTDSALQKGIKDAFGLAGMVTINSYLELGSGILILWYGGLMAMDGEEGMSVGKLITYQLYWNMLNNAYNNLLNVVTSLTRAAAAAERVFTLMDSVPDIDINVGRRLRPEEIRGHIEFKEVVFSYQMRPDKRVLDRIDLNIPAGSTCALVGKSGGGKSTLVNIIMRFYDPQEGSIIFDGHEMKDLCLADIRKSIGVVQQNTELFGGTIEENITYGLPEGSWTREDVISAAKKACAHEFIKDFPEGYQTRVGERGTRVSGGQKQRISIARVFLRNPRILLLDEATSALDAESESKVQQALDNLMTADGSNRTVVLVAHRLSTVMNADQICVVDGGKIREVGRHEDLLKMDGLYAALVTRQLKKKGNLLDADDSQGEDEDDDREDRTKHSSLNSKLKSRSSIAGTASISHGAML